MFYLKIKRINCPLCSNECKTFAESKYNDFFKIEIYCELCKKIFRIEHSKIIENKS